MRTAGLLLMDTPMPDGRLMVRPQDFVAASVYLGSTGETLIPISGTETLVAQVGGMLLRYGMSDDAQQNFGMGAPGSLGIQGAQAQVVTTGQPFTTPYGQSGRPPQSSSNFGKPTVSRPKGLKPMAVTVAYEVQGGIPTSLGLSLFKTAFNAGVTPAPTTILNTSALPTTVQFNVATVAIPSAGQVFLADPFDALVLQLIVTIGAATQINLYGAYIDFQFNYN